MAQSTADFLIRIDAPNLDDNELADLARLLQSNMEALDVDSVEPVTGEDVPKGAMAGEWIQIGSFLVKLTKSLIRPLIQTLDSWLKRQDASRIETTSESSLRIKIQYKDFSVVIDQTRSGGENIIKELEARVNQAQQI